MRHSLSPPASPPYSYCQYSTALSFRQPAMKTTTTIGTAAIVALGLLEGTAAFSPERSSPPPMAVPATAGDRRAFVGGVISAAFGAAAFANTPAAWADDEEKVEDLAMPSADEQKALDVSDVIQHAHVFHAQPPISRLLKRCRDHETVAPEKAPSFRGLPIPCTLHD